MPDDARQAAPLRPAAVAVHDDRDVAGGGSRRRPMRLAIWRIEIHCVRISFSFAAAAASIVGDRLVGQLLDLVLVALALVLARCPCFFSSSLSASMPSRRTLRTAILRLLGILAGELGQLLAALLGQVGDRQAQRLAVDRSG